MARRLSSVLGLTLLALLPIALSQTCSDTASAGVNNPAVTRFEPTRAAQFNMSVPDEPCSGGPTDKFMYNVWQGPPNQQATSSGLPRAVSPESSLDGNGTQWSALQWTANLTCKSGNSAPANGYPLGCCLNVGSTVLSGCVNCASTTVVSLPYGVSESNPLVVNGADTSGTVFTTGSSNTLKWPQQVNTAGQLGPGVYTFQLWVESLCGKQKSDSVSLVARCPPSPTVRAVVRATSTTNVLAWDSVNKAYTASAAGSFYIDASCSMPFIQGKPGNWGSANPNLYAIQTVWFTVNDTSVINLGGSTTATQSVTFSGTTVGISGSVLKSETNGVIIITVSDGCSAAQQMVSVRKPCGCAPLATASATSTIWGNVPTNFYNPAVAGVSNANNNPTEGGNEIAFALSGVASTTLDQSGTGNMDYDWSFVNWLPNYYTESYGGSNVYSDLNPTATKSFPPSSAAQCGVNTATTCTGSGDGWGLTTSACCFSTTDEVTTLAGFARPSPGNYMYKVLKIVDNQATTRKKTYYFMRLSGGCKPPVVGSWMVDTSIVTPPVETPTPCAAAQCTAAEGTTDTTLNALVKFVELPKFVQMSGDNVLQDFNVPDFQNTNANKKFIPTTQCGAWLMELKSNIVMTETQIMTNMTYACTGESDLLLCRVTIFAGDYGTPANKGKATLSVSSYGSCRGRWTFQLQVTDDCTRPNPPSPDTLVLDVGCNRRPNVDAGCQNSQAWKGTTTNGVAGGSFEQIALDGRASWDPDNFGDAFNNLAAQPSPQQCAAGTACDNGGLGKFGLTYAWALVSAPGYTNTTCPIPAVNPTTACDDPYCCAPSSNTCFFAYPWVDLTTGKWAAVGQFYGRTSGGVVNRPGASSPAFGPSVLGDTTLYQAWGSTNNQFSQAAPPAAGTAGTAPTVGFTTRRIFPLFNKACAPTVYPMFVDTAAAQVGRLFVAQGPDGVATDQTLWKSVQQLQHQGNTAYMQGLTQEGTYQVRLYAYDGCSVGFGDVTFTTKCSSIFFLTNYNNFQMASSYISGVVPTTFEWRANNSNANQFTVRYDGLAENQLSGTVTIVNSQNASWPLTPAKTDDSCLITQNTASPAPVERVMQLAVNDCVKNLIFARGSGAQSLDVGSYTVVVTITDGCSPKTPFKFTYPFTMECPNRVVMSYNEVSTTNARVLSTITPTMANPQNSSNYFYWAQKYEVPASSGQSAGQGKFAGFSLPLAAYLQKPGTTAGQWVKDTDPNKDVALSFTVYWSPKTCTGAGCTYNDAISGNIWNEVGTVAAVKTSTNENSLVPFDDTIRNVALYPNSSAAAVPVLSPNYWGLGNSANQGAQWNVVLDAAQTAFTANAASVFKWSGTYKLVVSAQGRVSSAPITCTKTSVDAMNRPVAMYVTYWCEALSDPAPFMQLSDSSGNNAAAFNSSVEFTTTGANLWCNAGNSPSTYCSANDVSIAGGFNPVYLTAASWNAPPATITSARNAATNTLTGTCYTNAATNTVVQIAVGGNNVQTATCSSGTWTANLVNPVQPTDIVDVSYTEASLGAFYQTSGTPKQSTVSLVPSYLSPVTQQTKNGVIVSQNMLLLSPVSYANKPRGFTNPPVVTNTNPTQLRLGMPGTWQVDIYGTNGCNNVSSAVGLQLAYYCPKATLPSAMLQYEVLPKAGAPTADDIWGDRVISCGVSGGPTGTVFNNTLATRRSLVRPEGADDEASRKLLNTAAENAALRGHYGVAGFLAGGSGWDKTAADTTCSQNGGFARNSAVGGTTLSVNIPANAPNVELLHSNYDAYIPVFFDSFQVTVPSGTVANWFGMGSLFAAVGTGNPGIGYNIYPAAGTRPVYQGQFEQVKMQAVYPTDHNNKAFSWFNLDDWSTTYTCGSQQCTKPWSGTCAWGRTSAGLSTNTIQRSSTNNFGTVGTTNPDMTVTGCSPLGQGSTVGIRGTSQASSWTIPTATYTRVTLQGTSGIGLVTSSQQSKDYQLIAWNGVPGASCYDYRAVRIMARCNVLYGQSVTNRNTAPISAGTPGVTPGSFGMFDVNTGARAQTPDVYTQIGAGARTLSSSLASAGSVTTPWTGSNFETVELDSVFDYYQCGMYTPSGSLPFCGSKVNSATESDRMGNLFSLVYSWEMLSSPVASWYDMGNNGNKSLNVASQSYGTVTTNSTTVGDVTTIVSKRNYTTTLNKVWHKVKLTNHAYNMPKTCVRPDVEGPYVVRLEIDDGCASWRSQSVTIQATCPPLANSGNINPYVTSAKATSPIGAPVNDATGAPVWTVNVDGHVFNRINVGVKPTAATVGNSFYTYSWTITAPTGYTETPQLTNSQSDAVSFVPVQMPMTSMATSPYTLTLKITNNCIKGDGTQATAIFTYKVNVVCALAVNIAINAPTVATTASDQDKTNYWGGATSYAAPANTARENRIPEYNYYAATTLNAYKCDIHGPFCSPLASSTAPTILFGGSLPPTGNGVVPGFQKYYFSVPGTVTSSCMIKKTYWVLTGYQNAQSFTPSYYKAPTAPSASVTCTPSQTWTLTITNTPCQPCSTNTNSDEGVRDVCMFKNYTDYSVQPFSSTILTPTSVYKPPQFFKLDGTPYQPAVAPTGAPATNGQYTGTCIYDAGQRKSADTFIDARRANCMISGKGRQVTIMTSAAANTACNNVECPMSQIQFVPRFPGVYELTFDVLDQCGPPVSTQIKISAQCKSRPKLDGVLKGTLFQQFYYCQKSGALYGDPTETSSTPKPGAFEPLKLSDVMDAAKVTVDPTTVSPVPESASAPCAVKAPSPVMNCSDVRNYVNSQRVAVDVIDSPGDNFKACCTCMYGMNTVNVFSVSPSGTTTRAAPTTAPVASKTNNLLALSEAEYHKNYVILVSIVAPLAVVLVVSLAGNVLTVLQRRRSSHVVVCACCSKTMEGHV